MKNNVPEWFCLVSTAFIALLIVIFIGYVFATAFPILHKEGISFITSAEWDYENHQYGILNYIAGTVFMTTTTLVIAVPVGICTGIFLSEWAPPWFEGMARPLIELLVGIPSVVFGIFGFFVLEDLFQYYIDPFIDGTLGFIPIFRDTDPTSGLGILLASTVLAVMVLPTITALTQEAMRAVPHDFREASFALGATRWETIRLVVIPAASAGILTSIVLSMMRAVGETMAVVMLIGNTPKIPGSILDTGYAMTSKILNEIGYYVAWEEHRAALFAVAAVLFLIEIGFVAVVRFVLPRLSQLSRSAHG